MSRSGSHGKRKNSASDLQRASLTEQWSNGVGAGFLQPTNGSVTPWRWKQVPLFLRPIPCTKRLFHAMIHLKQSIVLCQLRHREGCF